MIHGIALLSVHFHLSLHARFFQKEISNIDLNLCLPSPSSFHIRENMESVADLEDMKTNFQPRVMLYYFTIGRIFRLLCLCKVLRIFPETS